MSYYPDKSRSFFCVLLCVLFFALSALSSLAYEGDASAKLAAFGISTAVLLVVYLPAGILAVKYRKREIYVGEEEIRLRSVLPAREGEIAYSELDRIVFSHRKSRVFTPKMYLYYPDGGYIRVAINAEIACAVEKCASCRTEMLSSAKEENAKFGQSESDGGDEGGKD